MSKNKCKNCKLSDEDCSFGCDKENLSPCNNGRKQLIQRSLEMIRRILCWLGFHKWIKIPVLFCLAPRECCCASLKPHCLGCKYCKEFICKHCGKVKR